MPNTVFFLVDEHYGPVNRYDPTSLSSLTLTGSRNAYGHCVSIGLTRGILEMLDHDKMDLQQ
jgi:hypothetical protein